MPLKKSERSIDYQKMLEINRQAYFSLMEILSINYEHFNDDTVNQKVRKAIKDLENLDDWMSNQKGFYGL
jgi:hypothetical protein